jgi:hypothetical protein
MSKQHKMVWNGKKYITKISDDSGDGCAFSDFTIPYVCKLRNQNARCCNKDNKDNQYRIWVEDTIEKKTAKTTKTKDYYWIVEEYIEELDQWHGVGIHGTRWFARDAQSLYLRKTRVRQLVKGAAEVLKKENKE